MPQACLKIDSETSHLFLSDDHHDFNEADLDVGGQPTSGECDAHATDDDADTYLSD